jgi:coenzyme F420-reducing hydrogenase delta subunit
MIARILHALRAAANAWRIHGRMCGECRYRPGSAGGWWCERTGETRKAHYDACDQFKEAE